MAGAAADEGSRWSALPVRMVASPGLRCHEQCSWEEMEGEEEEEWSEAVDCFLGNCTRSRDKGTHLCACTPHPFPASLRPASLPTYRKLFPFARVDGKGSSSSVRASSSFGVHK